MSTNNNNKTTTTTTAAVRQRRQHRSSSKQKQRPSDDDEDKTTTKSSSLTTSLPSSASASLPRNAATRSNFLIPYLLVVCWVIAISCFLIVNYYKAVDEEEDDNTHKWRTWLLRPAVLFQYRNMWRFVHAISSMFFGGTIIVSTIIEYLVVASSSSSSSSSCSNSSSTNKNNKSTTATTNAVVCFWFDNKIPSTMDACIVLPALSASVVSGVAQAIQDYGSVEEAPVYIRGALHVLLTFGLWWVVTDVVTQQMAAQSAVVVSSRNTNDNINNTTIQLSTVLQWRRWSNVVSCTFVMVLYFLMAFKPGSSGDDSQSEMK